MNSKSHKKKFLFKKLRKCAKNEVWEKMDQNWSLGPATTGSMQKPDQTTNNNNTIYYYYYSNYTIIIYLYNIKNNNISYKYY